MYLLEWLKQIFKRYNTACWPGCRAAGTPLRCWWECKMARWLWKPVWQFLKSSTYTYIAQCTSRLGLFATIKCHWLDGLETKFYLLTILEAGSPRSRCGQEVQEQGVVPSEASLLGLQMAAFSLYPRGLSFVHLHPWFSLFVQISSFHKDTSQMGLGPIFNGLVLG